RVGSGARVDRPLRIEERLGGRASDGRRTPGDEYGFCHAITLSGRVVNFRRSALGSGFEVALCLVGGGIGTARRFGEFVASAQLFYEIGGGLTTHAMARTHVDWIDVSVRRIVLAGLERIADDTLSCGF